MILVLCLPGMALAYVRSRHVTIENDRFYDTDRYYTNGIQFSIVGASGSRPRLGTKGVQVLLVRHV